MTILSALFLAATVAYLALLVLVVLRNPRSSLNWVCAAILLCLALWSFVDIFNKDPRLPVERVRFFASLGSLGWCSFPGLLFLYSLILTRRRRVLRNWLTYPPLFATAALFSYLQWTGRLGVDYTPHAFGWATVWARNAWPPLYFAYPVLLAAAAVWVIADSRRRSTSPRERRQNLILVVSIVVPILLGMVTNAILPWLGIARFPELAPVFGLIWAGGLYYSATRYGLLAFSSHAAADEILSTMVDVLMLLAPDNRIINVNRSAQDVFGYRKSELVGRSAEFLFALPGQFRDEARQVLAGHEIRQQEITALARSGREIPMSISARIMRDSSGLPLGSVWVLHDMTVYRQSEKETLRLAEGLAALNRLAVDLAAAPADLDLHRFLAERLKAITNAVAVTTSVYLPATREMRICQVAMDGGLLARVNQVLGKSLFELSMPVTPEVYDRVVNATVGSAGDLTETTFGAIPRPVGAVIQKMLGIDYFTGLAFTYHDKLLGTAVISARTGHPTPHPDVLRTFANIAAVALHRKRLEDAMRESEEFHRNLVERANDGIVIIQDQLVRYANTRLRRMWGDPKANLEGMPFTDFVDPDEIPKLVRRYQQRIAGEDVPTTYETVLRRRDGSRIYVELNAGIISVQGKPADLIIIRDVTERRNAAIALHDSEESFRSLAERANDAIFISDAQGRYVFANERAAVLTGYPVSELLTVRFRDIVRPEDVGWLEARAAARLRGEPQPSQYEVTIRRRDGQEIPLELSVARTFWQGAAATLAVARDITERKQAELALRIERDRAEELLNIAGAIIVALDARGDVTLLNRAGQQTLGYPASELIGRNWFETCVPERVRGATLGAFHDLMAGRLEPAEFFENEVLTRDGRERLIAWHNSLLRDESGRITGTLSSGTDITDEREAQASLAESEERYRSLVENSPEPIIVHRDGVVLFTNAAAVDFLGAHEPGELTGRPLWSFLDEVSHELVRTRLRQIVEQGQKVPNVEETFVRRDGSIRIAEVASTLINYLGAPAVQTMIRDITQRKLAEAELLALRDRLEQQVQARTAELTLVNRQLQQEVEEHRRAEEQLRQSEVRFRGVFEQAPTGMCLTSPDGRFLDVNQALCRMLQYTHAELAATGFAAVTHPDDLPASKECLRSLLAGERDTHNFEKRYIKKTGDILWTDVSIFLLRTAQGTPQYFITHIFDITGRRIREERIRELNRELEKAIAQLETTNRELESFSYSVSHDLRAPLRSLDGFSQALLEDSAKQLDQSGRDHLNRIRAASQRMGQLIDDLLKLSRVTRSELHPESVNLSRLAQDIIDELSQAEPDRKITIIIAPDLHAVGDARLLRVLLANLLGNAWKFTSRRPDPVIEFGMRNADFGIPHSPFRNPHCDSRNPIFFVRDNGVGFDMTYISKLFNAFQRLHGIEDFPGSGIGLATAQRVVLRHEGQIWAQAVPDQGATFYFTLTPAPGD
jgi:PAS domain S-box-containing protein